MVNYTRITTWGAAVVGDKPEAAIHLLLVEDNPEYADVVKLVLASEETVEFQLTHTETLKDTLISLDEKSFDAILLDLSLPDCLGLDTFLAVNTHAPHLPIVVITALDDQEVAIRAVRKGAQDYLVKGDLDVNNLVRALRYSVERHRTFEQKLLFDDLTGLYNRRGFMHLAAQQLKIAQRARREQLLIYADLDDLKFINDTYGHPEGDRVLIDAAVILKETFRESDILARLGGDEFVVLAINVTPGNDSAMGARLSENLAAFNASIDREYAVSLSWGMAMFNPDQPCSLEELIQQADRNMYDLKHNKTDGEPGKSNQPGSTHE